MKRAYAEIDLNQLILNLGKIKKLLRPETEILGVVKADAYGHGAVPVAKALLKQGVNFFGVAWLSEAEELRKNKISTPILVLSQPDKQYLSKIIEYDLVQTVYHYDFVQSLSQAAGAKKVKVHVKVDTGMNRIGIAPEQTYELIQKIKQLKNIEIEGIFTHFACADEQDNPLNKTQLAKFNQLVQRLQQAFGPFKYIHAANSAATLNFPEAHYNLVRIGIALYRGILSFKSRIMFVKTVPPGTPVSYGSTFVTARPSKLATISVGYADGFSRLLSNKGQVLIRGKAYPLVGTVCMDMSIVDVTDTDIELGEEVVLIGRQGDTVISAQDVAKLIGTIDYEVMCGISKRVPRIYL